MQSRTIQILDSIRMTIRRHTLLEKGDAVLVGVSGGADSVCLLHTLRSLSEELELRIVVAHVHHGIRGEEADRDAEFVREICQNWQIPFYLKKVSVPELAERENISLETAGRLARYRYFREICDKENVDKIATAHNRDDQAETVLMRVIRGTGIDGLSGIKYIRPDGVVRPLLDVTREEIEEYCKENNLEYCVDSTNNENDYTRNKVRNQLLPILKEQFNPNILGAIANLSQNMAEDGVFINGYAKRLYRRINSPIPKRRPVVLDIESLKMVEPAIRTRLLCLAAEDAMGKGYRPQRQHWEAVNALLDKETGALAELPGGLTVAVRYGWLAFETLEDREQQNEKNMIYESAEIGKSYITENGNITLELVEPIIKPSKNQMLIDYDKIKDIPLEIRSRKTGDRIAIYQDGKEKKLKDFLIDIKIPRQERDGIPLLCSGKMVIAVIGHRVAEPYKVTQNSKRGMVITYDTKDESRQYNADRGAN